MTDNPLKELSIPDILGKDCEEWTPDERMALIYHHHELYKKFIEKEATKGTKKEDKVSIEDILSKTWDEID